ncbi:MAG: flagellar hook-basal body complex protein FliE [Candidatus Melainabacteria bacterium]|nr:flagellar hook-basal body complex protein FliE [Candidatus Melainabacteria bacterium]MBI3308412.1 flagellar hook-basal body complex protein FliE [Candidatus Melainabacteria bacterium]
MTQFGLHNYHGVPQMPQIPNVPALKGQISTGGGEFKDVLAGMLGKVNTMMNRSEELTVEAVTTGKVDLHEVMIAMAEEEIALGITTQVAGKFIGTVEKLTQMQV